MSVRDSGDSSKDLDRELVVDVPAVGTDEVTPVVTVVVTSVVKVDETSEELPPVVVLEEMIVGISETEVDNVVEVIRGSEEVVDVTSGVSKMEVVEVNTGNEVVEVVTGVSTTDVLLVVVEPEVEVVDRSDDVVVVSIELVVLEVLPSVEVEVLVTHDLVVGFQGPPALNQSTQTPP